MPMNAASLTAISPGSGSPRPLLLASLLFGSVLLAAPSVVLARNSGTPEQMQACRVRQAELARKTEEFKGETRMKRLIEADLRRASQEESEGDGDECLEALDHAAKLLAGDV